MFPEHRQSVMNMLLGKDNSAMCSVKEDKGTPEAFSDSYRRWDQAWGGSRSTESINVETERWNTVMISILASEKQACASFIFVSMEPAQYWCLGQVAARMIYRTFLCFL